MPLLSTPVAAQEGEQPSFTLTRIGQAHYDSRLGVQAGLYFPGLLGLEVAMTTFGSGVFADVRAATSSGVRGPDQSSSGLGAASHFVGGRIGFGQRRWIYGKSAVPIDQAFASNEVGELVAAVPTVRGDAGYLGFEWRRREYAYTDDEPGFRIDTTPTLVAGWHWEGSANFTIDVDRYGTTRIREMYLSDLEAFYGVSGPEQGLGLQWRFEAMWDWVRLGFVAGYIVAGTDPQLHGPGEAPDDRGASVWDRGRALMYLGLPYQFNWGKRVRRLAPGCVMRTGGVDAC